MSQSLSFTDLSRGNTAVVRFWLLEIVEELIFAIAVCVHIIIWHSVMAVQPDFTANKDCFLSPRPFPSQQSQVQLMALNHGCVTKPLNLEKNIGFFFSTRFQELSLFLMFQDLWLRMMGITFSPILSLWEYLTGMGLQIKHVMACAVANYLFHLLPSRIF